MATTPEQGMAAIESRFGRHPRSRALHAKGAFLTATFTATPEAAKLTRAGHMSGAPTPATVRFSNGGGDPNVPDYVPDVRGLAVAFNLADGTRTDLLSQTLPRFPFSDQEGFFAAMEISKPSFRSLLKFPAFAFRYPGAVKALPETNRRLNSRAGFAAREYFPFHAFRWLDADGGSRYVRYRWAPAISEPEPTKQEAKEGGRDYLFDDLRARLAREPVRMELEVTIAGEGDDPDDPSAIWSDACERVVVGTLEATAIDEDADDDNVMDPMRLVDGIEPSADPVLTYRPPVYSLSHARRTGS